MPCYQNNSVPNGFSGSGSGAYQSEAECLQACKEGACCNGTTCSVKPQCQCNAAAGEVFKGVGEACSPNPCLRCEGLLNELFPNSIGITLTDCTDNAFGTDFASMNGSYSLAKMSVQNFSFFFWRVTYLSGSYGSSYVQLVADCYDSTATIEASVSAGLVDSQGTLRSASTGLPRPSTPAGCRLPLGLSGRIGNIAGLTAFCFVDPITCGNPLP